MDVYCRTSLRVVFAKVFDPALFQTAGQEQKVPGEAPVDVFTLDPRYAFVVYVRTGRAAPDGREVRRGRPAPQGVQCLHKKRGITKLLIAALYGKINTLLTISRLSNIR